MLEGPRAATLVAATVTTGLLAGLFFAYSVSVMPGLGRTGDRTFIDAMQQINEAIVNPWFFSVFGGAAALTIIAAAVHLPRSGRTVLPWIVAAAVLNGAGFAFSFGFDVPLNHALAAAGPPDQITDLTQVRTAFEAAWVRWNNARAVAHTAAFGCLTWALVIYGRTRAEA
ncbi:MAG: DUF1772 domain-containing protein [Pseudonocardiaceae bacterium]